MTEHGAGSAESRAFLRQFKDLVERLLRELPGEAAGGEQLAAVLTEHLGAPAERLAIVTEMLPEHRLVDADIALEEVAEGDPDERTIGIGGGDMRHHMTLGDLLQHGRFGPGLPTGQIDYARLATGPRADDHRQVMTSGVRLFRFEGEPVAVRVQGRNRQFGREEGSFEVLAPQRPTAEAVISRIRALMDEHSILRGQVISFGSDPYGPGLAGMTFVDRPTLTEDDVVLPDGELDRIRAHVVGIGTHRARLQSHGQHLKRGVLLYGPPGTGKTHTVRYLLSSTPGTTAVLLSGGALAHIHTAAKVARAHQPAVVVLEDVDLVAEDRSFAMGPQPLLFEVLDALDGLDPDADVAFVLTTNRVDNVEVALSQRPGRVDLAAEIPLPDRDGRLALLRLYGGHLFGEDAMAAAAERSEGTTASFAKELVRRAVLTAAVADSEPTDVHLAAALDALLTDAESLTRSLLGVSPGATDGFEGGDGGQGEPVGAGWAGGVPGPMPVPGGMLGRMPGRGGRRGRGQGTFGYYPG